MAHRHLISALLGLFLVTTPVPFLSANSAAQNAELQTSEKTPTPRSFTKKHYTIDGGAIITETKTGPRIVFNDAFETRSGPDLKVYLSKLSISELEDETVSENSLKIGVLKSRQGTQSYSIPENISLKDYKSVIIHCEAFSMLWGGFDF